MESASRRETPLWYAHGTAILRAGTTDRSDGRRYWFIDEITGITDG
ncbi:MAG: hypothetical protein OXJ90_28835 [Spirochaetaceae bacterium]|nr:hypothetical protein [Spirochaetaceae bacterium]